MTELQGKVAIVTGGNSGIGASIVLELARLKAQVVIDYIFNKEATDLLEKKVALLGDQVIGVEADVSKIADLKKLSNRYSKIRTDRYLGE